MKGDRPSYPKETVDLTVALPYHARKSPEFHDCTGLSLGLWQTGTAHYGPTFITATFRFILVRTKAQSVIFLHKGHR